MIYLFPFLLGVYIIAVNFCAYRIVAAQREKRLDGEKSSDGKLYLCALLGGAPAVYVTMFCLRYRLEDILLMIIIPLIAVLNFYCYFIGFRAMAVAF
ncbi:MAG: hypothetical protein J6C93_07255 [Clostridia bacterium]|nr:hypothetical protein [Clostridia bacterium]